MECQPCNIVIMGAAGRDFHNFNMICRDNPVYKVVAFTATQIPGIDARKYPADLAGSLYPDGIPIVPEAQLETLCADGNIDTVVFAYSDMLHADVMHAASRAIACGCDFVLWGPERTMLQSSKPVIAVTAVRTGCGKSQVSRYLAEKLQTSGQRVAVIRHPMPYGNLSKQAVQRFATMEDLELGECTIEEREEYEPYVERGLTIFAGADYARILAAAEAEADLVLWDGGNNDLSFVRPDVLLTLTDALRPGHETAYWPGEANLRMADIVIVAKSDAAGTEAAELVAAKARAINPKAELIFGGSPVELDDPSAVKGRRVLVVEDGPTITHGGMKTGAGYAAAKVAGAGEIIDPRPFAVPEIAAVFAQYPHIGPVLPAVGYSQAQQKALADTIAASGADLVIAGTPIDLAERIAHLRSINTPIIRARYNYRDLNEGALITAVQSLLNAGK